MIGRAATALMLLLAGCGPQGFPRLTFPQYEQAKESVHGGLGKRYQDHAECKSSSTDAKSMVACMEAKGYGFLPRIAEPQAEECWRLRDHNDVDPLPEALCFVHKDEPAP